MGQAFLRTEQVTVFADGSRTTQSGSASGLAFSGGAGGRYLFGERLFAGVELRFRFAGDARVAMPPVPDGAEHGGITSSSAGSTSWRVIAPTLALAVGSRF